MDLGKRFQTLVIIVLAGNLGMEQQQFNAINENEG